jgi:hypothetical protein
VNFKEIGHGSSMMGLQWILKLNSQSCEIALEPTKDNDFCSLEQKWSMDEP